MEVGFVAMDVADWSKTSQLFTRPTFGKPCCAHGFALYSYIKMTVPSKGLGDAKVPGLEKSIRNSLAENLLKEGG